MRRVMLCLLMLLSLAPARAQVADYCPTACIVTGTEAIQFTVPTTHADVLSYRVRFTEGTYIPANQTRAALPEVAVGKPAPDAAGAVVVRPFPPFASTPVNTAYRFMVLAEYQGGVIGISPSSPYFYRRQCDWVLTVFYQCGRTW